MTVGLSMVGAYAPPPLGFTHASYGVHFMAMFSFVAKNTPATGEHGVAMLVSWSCVYRGHLLQQEVQLEVLLPTA